MSARANFIWRTRRTSWGSGRNLPPPSCPPEAWTASWAQRFVSGFDLNEMVSEYRALRKPTGKARECVHAD